MTHFETIQQENNLEPDGIFGKNSFKVLSNALNISNQIHAVHFFAQCAHETSNFTLFEESLRYSARALRSVFGKYFTKEQAVEYARKPEKIANIVYANRMGNGDTCSGEGWKYRGRGALQLTGKNNYQSFADYVNDQTIVDYPETVLQSKYLFKSAIFFFDKNNLWNVCNDLSEDTVKKLTKRINGGYNGLEHRIELTKKYSNWLI